MANKADSFEHKSRCPDNSAFKQQRLPAWSPSLTAETVLPFFYFMGVVCVVLGAVLLHTVERTQEIKVDYTSADSCELCFQKHKQNLNAAEDCFCKIAFTLKEHFEGDVYFYYGLLNFHQNLRRYMDSRDDAQLIGRKNSLKNPSTYCGPFFQYKNDTPTAPCGAIANSMFNDSFTFNYHPPGSEKLVIPLFRKGMAWYTDKNVKFQNPKASNEPLSEVFKGTAKPLYWQKPVYELDPNDPNNNGFINEDLIVWMREAAFPNFKKLYGILDRQSEPTFQQGLPNGNYSVSITYRYPVQYFNGRKLVVLSTVSWFGGQNYFLPIAYLVSGCVILVAAVILTGLYLKFGKKGMNMEE